ncbi:putative membrane protein YdjX (TVP38/TMEM64 family) [Bacillus ectoiniformans]|uniref:TVP38/TMEM64 family protein n=1 Tax=Bacillus ectoiniformans TaxID=1494429 RepID=UPI00195D483B|nr:VTT domain-containing protein [Bacillus ectoiniformans]MBM7647765.1 putative membrane protein YdjX (TVP38/TMEM64 family) [Bacillus ectoiniformans]
MELLLDALLSVPLWIAALFSVLLNIGISIAGVIPSAFLTTVNLVVFGFWPGLFLSFIGEILGAAAAFVLYRRGFRRFINQKATRYPKAERLLELEGKQAFYTVLTLRLLPFIPSGVVTFFAAIGKISFLSYFTASLIGKIPATFMEAYTAYQMVNWTIEGQFILIAAAIALLIYIVKKFYHKNRYQN